MPVNYKATKILNNVHIDYILIFIKELRMARRADHTRAELKDMILAAGWDIVEKEGFGDLTARKIAQAIGYAPGTIYNVFGSMDDVYLHLNARTLELLLEALSGDICNDPDKQTLDNLKCMAAVYANFARTYRNHWLMLFSGQLPETRQDQQWYSEKIDQLFGPLETLLTPLFKNKSERERKIATRSLFSAVHGLCFLQETGRVSLINQHAAEEEMANYLIERFVAGLSD